MTSSAREFAEQIGRIFDYTLDPQDHEIAEAIPLIEFRDADIVREAAQDIGPCGKHPRMFQKSLIMADNLDEGPQLYECTICAEVREASQAAYERAKQDVGDWLMRWVGWSGIKIEESAIRQFIAAIKDRGAGGGQ